MRWSGAEAERRVRDALREQEESAAAWMMIAIAMALGFFGGTIAWALS